MIKKIIFLLIVLIISFFLLFSIFLEKFFINKTILDIEKELNISISLNEDYKFTLFPNLSILTKFNLRQPEYNVFIKNAEFNIYKNYDLKPAKFIFNTEKIEIEKIFIDQLVSEGTIKKYSGGNFRSKFEIYPKGNIYYNLNSDEITSLSVLRIIIKRLNLPDTYKKLFDLTFNILNEKSFFTSKIRFDEKLIIIDYFESNKNDFNLYLKGTYDLQTRVLNFNINLNHNNEKLVKLKITDNIDNPNISILSKDNSINLNFFMNDIDKILDGGIEKILSYLISSQ